MDSKNASYVMLVLEDRTRCERVSGWLDAMDFPVRVFHSAEDAAAGLDTAEPPRLIVTSRNRAFRAWMALISAGASGFSHGPHLVLFLS